MDGRMFTQSLGSCCKVLTRGGDLTFLVVAVFRCCAGNTTESKAEVATPLRSNNLQQSRLETKVVVIEDCKNWLENISIL